MVVVEAEKILRKKSYILKEVPNTFVLHRWHFEMSKKKSGVWNAVLLSVSFLPSWSDLISLVLSCAKNSCK